MGIEDLAARLDDLTQNWEALTLLILKGLQAVPILSRVLLDPSSSIPEPRCLTPLSPLGVGGEYGVDFEPTLPCEGRGRVVDGLGNGLGNGRMWSPPRPGADGH